MYKNESPNGLFCKVRTCERKNAVSNQAVGKNKIGWTFDGKDV